jgi:hypothetical protein
MAASIGLSSLSLVGVQIRSAGPLSGQKEGSNLRRWHHHVCGASYQRQKEERQGCVRDEVTTHTSAREIQAFCAR